jgi:hypothetical protein
MLSLLALSLAGCVLVPIPSETYFPSDFGSAPATKRCSPARLDVRLLERGDVTLDVSLREGPNFRGSLQLHGPARFLDSRMTVREYGLATPLAVESMNCVPPGLLRGTHECEFESSITAREISVQFPAFEVEDSRQELPPVRFAQHVVRSMCWMSVGQLGQL